MDDGAVEATDDDASIALHAAEVTAHVGGGDESPSSASESESGESEQETEESGSEDTEQEPEEGEETGRAALPDSRAKLAKKKKKKAKDEKASEAPVFEDAQYFGAKFESFWNRLFSHYSAYDETTTIPAMCYTHGSDCDVTTMDTLQVFSVKIVSIDDDTLRWPLQVFGMVSARDVMDRKRNIIFHREREDCQTITQQDPYLTLTGPSRAIVVSDDPSYIEVVLKVKGATESSDDEELSRLALRYRFASCVTGLYPCDLSTLELTFGLVADSVEATVHVKVTRGPWPDGFKGVFSAANARNEGVKIKLLDVSSDVGLPVEAADGMIKLSRCIVSVERRGMLKLFVSACSPAGDEEHCEASVVPAESGVSSGIELKIGSCLMEATVAWSLFCDDY